MAKHDTYKCDVDGTIKGATNSWFVAIVVPGAPAIEFWEWSDAAAANEHAIHLCGETCVAAKASQWAASTRKVEAHA